MSDTLIDVVRKYKSISEDITSAFEMICNAERKLWDLIEHEPYIFSVRIEDVRGEGEKSIELIRRQIWQSIAIRHKIKISTKLDRVIDSGKLGEITVENLKKFIAEKGGLA